MAPALRFRLPSGPRSPVSGGDTYADLHFVVFGIYETNARMLKIKPEKLY
jgi:hypothetical protein